MFRANMVARRVAVRGVDFAKLAPKVSSAAARSELAQLRAAHEDVISNIKESSKPVAPIDWAYYKKNISNASLVDAFEKEYNGLQFPEFKNEIAQLADKKLQELVGEAKSVMDASAKRATELEALLAELEANRTTVDTSIDDYLARNKDVKAVVEDEVKKSEYFKDLQ